MCPDLRLNASDGTVQLDSRLGLQKGVIGGPGIVHKGDGPIFKKNFEGVPLRQRFFPESNVGGFSYLDAGIALYTQIDAILRKTDHVLDFGAGRGEHIADDVIEYRRRIFNLQGRCAHLEGCDVDSVVLTNPFLDHSRVIIPGEALPYADDSFDVIVARFVFEHIEEPVFLGEELLRILKPGGVIAALTPNRYGYIALAATIIPNSLHVRALKYIQPKRKAADVFPTRYRLNTRKALARTFGTRANVFTTYVSGEPGYHFGNIGIYRFFTWLHKHLPDRFRPLLIIYICKI